MKTFESVSILRGNFKNWLSLGLNLKFSKKIQLQAVLRSGQSYLLYRNYLFAIIPLLKKGLSVNEVIENLLNDKIPYKNSYVVVHGWIGENNRNNGNILDVFIKEEYKFLDVKNKVVKGSVSGFTGRNLF